MARRVRLVVVAEDRQSEMFLRQILYLQGIHRRDITFKTAPKACQSADSWVLAMHGKEAKTLRAHAHAQPNTGMVTCIDADNHAVLDRHQQLGAVMEQPRQPKERMAWLVPKRNIETWLVALLGNPADEASDFKRRGQDPEPCLAQAKAFWQVALEDASVLPSLCTARLEIDRIRP